MIKNNQKKLIIVDVDGTLVFNGEARAKANIDVTGMNPIPEDIYVKLPRSTKQTIHDLIASKYKRYLRPNKELIDIINGENGSKVIVLTGRTSSVEQDTKETLDIMGLRYDELHTNPNKSIRHTQFKSNKLKALTDGFNQVDIYEDNGHNIDVLKRQADDRFRFFLVNEGGMLRV